MANKIKFGLSNCYYSKLTWSGGTPSWAAPVAIPGAVSLSMDAQGDMTKFYADNVVYYATSANDGYEGDLEVAILPDSFRTDILNEQPNAAVTPTGMVYEDANMQPAAFALLFQIEGDDKARRHVLYNCTCSRPALNGQTKEASVDPNTESLTITASAIVDNSHAWIKGYVDEGGNAYATFFSAAPTMPSLS